MMSSSPVTGLPFVSGMPCAEARVTLTRAAARTPAPFSKFRRVLTMLIASVPTAETSRKLLARPAACPQSILSLAFRRISHAVEPFAAAMPPLNASFRMASEAAHDDRRLLPSAWPESFQAAHVVGSLREQPLAKQRDLGKRRRRLRADDPVG